MKSIFFDTERTSDSSFVERVWTSHSDHGGNFTSVAECRWEIVISKLKGKTTLHVRGPETRTTSAYCPPQGEWIGIRFRPDTYLRGLIPKFIADTVLSMPESKKGQCWMLGHKFEIPSPDNVELFVSRLIKLGLLTRDSVIDQRLAGEPVLLSPRTVQRRFALVLGLTENQVFQIERARYAASLLRDGKSILDTVEAAGYFDQAHLTRWVGSLMGETPSKIAETADRGRLSFLCKTR